MANVLGSNSGGVLFRMTTLETVATTATETKITGATIAANSLNPGDALTIEGAGVVGNTSTPTLTMKTYFGATAVLTSGAITMVNISSGPACFIFRVTATILTVGATGTALFAQWMSVVQTTTSSVVPALAIATVDTTPDSIDTTAANNFAISFQWGTSSSSNTITVAQEWVTQR